MARFYATFDNSTVSGLEAASGANFYNRKAFTNGSTLKTALVNARSALSSAFYAQINAGNRDGSLGITVPQGTFTNDGTNISFTNIYTNSGAVWPSDPRVRPTAPITAANSTPVSPTDGGSFTASLYSDATTALGNALAGIASGGPNGRLGFNAWRTLASLWHDHSLTYLAWDDFTPGSVVNLAASWIGDASNFAINANWDAYEYTNDQNPAGKIRLEFDLASTTGGTSYNYDTGQITPPTSTTVQWQATPVAGSYLLTIYARLYDATIPEHYGALAAVVNQAVTVPASGSPASGNGNGTGGSPPDANPFQDPNPAP